jgi:hypothetical protein
MDGAHDTEVVVVVQTTKCEAPKPKPVDLTRNPKHDTN